MRNLIKFADRDDVSQFLQRVFSEAPSEHFQGVYIAYHPIWESLWYGRSKTNLTWFWPYYTVENPFGETPVFEGVRDVDPSWKPPEWRTYCSDNGLIEDIDPFIIIFRLKPNRLDSLDIRRQILDIISSDVFFTTIEERPVAKLHSSSGSTTVSSLTLKGGLLIQTASGAQGTLGGFIKDTMTGDIFGVTCAHLAQVGEDIEFLDKRSNSWIKLGSCVEASDLTPHTSCGANCYKNGSAVDVDSALIQLDTVAGGNEIEDLGAIVEIADPQNIPRSIEIYGGVSHHIRLEANKFGIWQEFELPDGQCKCFSRIFEVETPNLSILTPKISLLFAKMVKNGDSGSWVCAPKPSGGYDLCGSLIGGDTICGFAIFFDSVKNWSTTTANIKRILGPV